MANKKYINDSMQNSTFQVNSHKPMDDRLVIRLRENLMQPETWQLTPNGDVMLYSGIIVNVIDDMDANNGLYSLKNWTKYDKQSWDETDDLTYDPAGWKKLYADSSDIFLVTLSAPVASLDDITSNNVQSDKTAEEICNAYRDNKQVIYQLQYNTGNRDYTYILTQYSKTYKSLTGREQYVINLYLFHQLYSSYWLVTLNIVYHFNDSSLSHIGYNISKSSGGLTVRTINHEQLTNSTLGDINIHDGYYFPNAVQDYDGNWYGAVIIGDQVWLGENLRTTHYSDGTAVPDGSNSNDVVVNPQPFYYHVNNDASLDDEYGLLYNWMAVMNGASETNANPSGVQGIAPVGWHIPSGSEVDTLTQYVSNQKRFITNNITSDIAKSLAYHSLWNSSSASITPGTNQTDNNKTGFAAKSAGDGYIDTSMSTPEHFNHLGTDFRMWTTNYVEFVIQYNYSAVYKFTNPSLKYFGHSVRCVSDLTPVQFRNWYVETYGTMQHHLNENIIVNQNYDLYRCVMSYAAWNDVMGSGEYPAGTSLVEYTSQTNPYIILNHVDKPNYNPIIISKFNATNGQYEPLLPQQQSFVGLNNLITNAATNDHGAYQFELLPDMVNPVYHVFDIQHGLYAVWHKNGDAEMGNVQTIYQGILIGVTTSIGNDTEEIAFMLKIYKNSI